MKVVVSKEYEVNGCYQCPFCKILPDPDPDDWFCDDDVKMICTHKDRGEHKKEEVNQYFFKVAEENKHLGRYICGGLRPYEVKGNYVPDWCPEKK